MYRQTFDFVSYMLVTSWLHTPGVLTTFFSNIDSDFCNMMEKMCEECRHYEPLSSEERKAFMKMFDGHCMLNESVVYYDDVCERFKSFR